MHPLAASTNRRCNVSAHAAIKVYSSASLRIMFTLNSFSHLVFGWHNERPPCGPKQSMATVIAGTEATAGDHGFSSYGSATRSLESL